MHTLTIQDLSVTETLDRTALRAVRGGMYKGFAPYWAPHISISERKDLSFKADQLISQTQDVANFNGNNVAFATDIHSTVKPVQTATNNIHL